jgi:hypothetical protein
VKLDREASLIAVEVELFKDAKSHFQSGRIEFK